MSLAVHGKIMETIALQPPAVHHMRLLSQLCTGHSVYFTTACQSNLDMAMSTHCNRPITVALL